MISFNQLLTGRCYFFHARLVGVKFLFKILMFLNFPIEICRILNKIYFTVVCIPHGYKTKCLLFALLTC